MEQDSEIATFGYAVGLAGRDSGSAFAPLFMQRSSFLQNLPVRLNWKKNFYIKQSAPQLAAIPAVAEVCSKLADEVFKAIKRRSLFLVFGGDHSSAIGTWSGASAALSEKGDLGLIWFDAHLDSNTPKTTPSGNVHGMPLAVLLGYGDKYLKNIQSSQKKIKPRNVCIIGARSYEPEELHLLQRLGVKIYFMAEVRKRGLKAILAEAVSLVSKHSVGFGISVDLDVIDPKDAPAVGSSEPGGLSKKDFLQYCRGLAQNPLFIGLEIVEFNPFLDVKQKTERLTAQIVECVFA